MKILVNMTFRLLKHTNLKKIRLMRKMNVKTMRTNKKILCDGVIIRDKETGNE